MKFSAFRFPLVTLLLCPSLSFAEMPAGGMNQENMQKMMGGMAAMQNCMANVDQAEMQKYQAKAMAFQDELKALCDKGKRDEAMSRAMKFSKESMANPALQAMQKCGQGMQGMMPSQTNPSNSNDKPTDVCDSIRQ
jgi:flagellar basal body rod protein FlgB